MGIAYQLVQPAALKQVVVVTGRPGATVEIRAGDGPDAQTVVGASTTLNGTTTIPITATAPASYYVVWITQLTSEGNGQFWASLSEVTFKR